MGKIIRRVIAILLAVTAVILICIPASSASATTQRGDFVMDGSTLVSYTGADAELTLPNTITAVGKGAFTGNKNLRKVVIPDSVKTIDYAAFENCVNLQTAKIGEGVRTIGSSAFSGCKNLVIVNIPEKCDTLGSGVFAGCRLLPNVNIAPRNLYYVCVDGVIYSRDGSELVQYLPGRTSSAFTMPATVNTIGEYAFWGSDSLASVTVSRGVKEIPEYAFSNCNSLGKVILPTSVESLMAYSFADCPNLRSVAIPDSVGYIDDKAFYLSNGATIQFVSPDNAPAKEVPVSQIAAVTSASTASIPAGGGNAGASATPMPTPTVNPNAQDRPDGYTSSLSGSANWVDVIRDRDFSNNVVAGELGSGMIVGGNAVMLMSSDMPVRGYNLEDAENEDLMAVSGGNTTSSADAFNTIEGTLASYNGNDSNVLIPEGITTIGQRAFYKNASAANVSIPEGVENIDEFAFSRSSLESVNIPSSVTNIDYAAFYHCENLADVTIPPSVDNIELGAFDGTKWLNDFKSSDDGNSYLVVGNGILLAYKGEGGNVSIPDGVKQIAAGCFEGNSNITGARIPKGVTKIGEDAFNGCINLTSLTLPEGLTTIEDRAFCDTSLDSVIIPDSVESIGLGAFDTTGNMSPLKTVLLYGTDVPNVSNKDTATRLSAKNLRVDALNGVENIIVQADCDLDSGTLLNPKYHGFHGQVFKVSEDSTDSLGTLSLLKTTKQPDSAGAVNIDANVPIGSEYYVMNGVREHAFDDYLNYNEWCNTKPTSVNVIGNKSTDLNNLLSSITDAMGDKSVDNAPGVSVVLECSDMAGRTAAASLTDSDDSYTLVVSDDAGITDSINAGLYNYYGPGTNVSMVPLDLSMYDKSGTVPIHKFGNSKLDVTLPLPSKFEGMSDVMVASLDENGSLTELPASVMVSDTGSMISFVANHCSPFVIYVKSEGLAEVTMSVDSEDAGSIRPDEGGVLKTLNKNIGNIKAKWFVIAILLCLSVILLLYKPSKQSNK